MIVLGEPMETMLVIREPSAGPGFKSSTASSSGLQRAPRHWFSRVAHVGLVCVTGMSVLARSDEATKIGGKSAKDWVAALRSDDPKARWEAFGALMLFGPAASGEVPALIDALDDPRTDVQTKACEALRDLGPGAMAAAPALTRKLASRGPDILIAKAAEEALVAIGPAALPSVIRCLEGDDTEARHCAMLVLARFGPAARDAVPALARLVNLPDGEEARAAIAVLAKIGPGASAAIPALSAAYESLELDDDDRKYELLNALPRIGAPPCPRIIKDLNDPDPDRRASAVLILSEFGTKAHSAAGQLEALLDDPSPVLRVNAAGALLSVDPANPRILAALSSALDSRDIDILDSAIDAIAKLGPSGALVAPKLKSIVARMGLASGTQRGDVFSTKARAALALIAISPASGEGVAALVTLLNDGDDFRGPAIEGLARSGPRGSAAIPALVAVSRDPKSAYRFKAIQALARIDGGHEAILPALIELVSAEPAPAATGATKSRMALDKQDALLTMSRMGAKALPAVPCLLRVLAVQSEDEHDSWKSGEKLAAVQALGCIGPPAKDAVPILIKSMRTERHPDLREQRSRAAKVGSFGPLGPDWTFAVPALVGALGAMGAAASPAVPDLIEMLDAEAPLPSLATQTLGSIGPEARAAVGALIKRLIDKTPYVAAEAGAALLRIDPSKRDLVEARLRSFPVSSNFYERAILCGALGRRTPEADGYARRFLLMIDSHLDKLVALTAENQLKTGGEEVDQSDDQLNAREEELADIEGIMDRLGSFGTGAGGAIGRLTELTRHAEPEVRRLAAETLKRIRPR